MPQVKGTDAMEAVSDKRPKRKKADASFINRSTRPDPHREAAIGMLPPDDTSVTCDSCDKDIKYVSDLGAAGVRRRAWLLA